MTKTEAILAVCVVAAVSLLAGLWLTGGPDAGTPAPVSAPAAAAVPQAPAEPKSEADRLIEVLESYSVLTAAGQKAGEGAIYHLVMALIGIATIMLVTGDHGLGNRLFPGAGRVHRRGERLRKMDDPPWEERESQHRNEAFIACARIIGAAIVLGFTLS